MNIQIEYAVPTKQKKKKLQKRNFLPKQIKHWFQKANLGRFAISGWFANEFYMNTEDKNLNRIVAFQLSPKDGVFVDMQVDVFYKYDSENTGIQGGPWLVGLFKMPTNLLEFLQIVEQIKHNLRGIR